MVIVFSLSCRLVRTANLWLPLVLRAQPPFARLLEPQKFATNAKSWIGTGPVVCTRNSQVASNLVPGAFTLARVRPWKRGWMASCLVQYLDNAKHFTRDREQYTLENLPEAPLQADVRSHSIRIINRLETMFDMCGIKIRIHSFIHSFIMDIYGLTQVTQCSHILINLCLTNSSD